MNKIWWILCNIGAVIIIHNMWMQMEGFDKWCAVLFSSSMWICGLLDEYGKHLEEAA